MPRSFLLYPLLGLLCLLSACIAHQPVHTEDAPAKAWEQFLAKTKAATSSSTSFLIASSLRYTDQKGDNNRVSSLLWGNSNVSSPLRLDIMAGAGNTVIAKIQESPTQFLAYHPDKKTAYTHAKGHNTLPALGVPIPLTLGDLFLLLTGRSGELFLPQGLEPGKSLPAGYSASASGFLFPLQGAALSGTLELTKDGTPLSWQEHASSGWTIAFDPSAEGSLHPRRLRISHPEGYSAVVTVKEVSPQPPYTMKQLALELPQDTQKKALQEFFQ